MATEKEMKLAKAAYDTLCDALDARNWRYEKHKEELVVAFGVNGDDLTMPFVIAIDAERQLVRLMSLLPFRMDEEKRVEGAIATCHASFRLADGSFDYNLADGSIVFRLTSSFRESLIGEELLNYMVDVACVTVDEYNDKFEKINNGELSITDFLEEN